MVTTKIQAIKALRNATGCSLKVAKETVCANWDAIEESVAVRTVITEQAALDSLEKLRRQAAETFYVIMQCGTEQKTASRAMVGTVTEAMRGWTK